MGKHWRIIVVAAIILLPTTIIVPARGAPVYAIVAPSQVTLQMNLSISENITSLPLANIYPNSSASRQIIDHLQPAFQKLVPGATIATLNLQARTINASRTWILSENYTLVITGVNTNSGSAIRSNTGFLTMNVADGISLGGLELNNVGQSYLLAPLNSQPANTAYFINGGATLNAAIPAQTTQTFSILDFSWVPAVSFWTRKDDLLGQSTTWTFDQGSPRFNLTYGPKSPEGPLIKTFTAVYYPAFQLTVPANAWASGSTVYFDLATPSELVMPTIILISIMVLGTTFLLDRRLSVTQRFRAKKR
jgi:hypothetical protein